MLKALILENLKTILSMAYIGILSGKPIKNTNKKISPFIITNSQQNLYFLQLKAVKIDLFLQKQLLYGISQPMLQFGLTILRDV